MIADTGTKHALLLGAPAGDLDGVEHDVALMTAALQRHGFDPIRAICPATRADMVAALDQLIAAARPADTIVLYYSGHGSKIQPERHGRAGLGEDSYYRFLLPSDFPDSTEEDFRGYTSTELSLALAKLTHRTPNVTVIMDCCFAGRVFRRGEKQAEDEQIEWQDTSRRQPTRYHESNGRWLRSAARHFDALRQIELGDDMRAAEANPHAVQLLASSSVGRAYETPCAHADCGYGAAGAMTLALHDVLMRVEPAHTTWQDVGRMIRMTPRRANHDQLVSVEGPHRRFLFRLDEREELGAVNVDTSSGRVHFVGGALADLRPKDRYEFVAFGRRGNEEILAVREVGEVRSSFATVEPALDVETLVPGTRARPIRFGESRGVVALEGIAGEVERALLEARITAVGLTPIADLDHRARAETPPVARLQLADGKLRLFSGEHAFDVPRGFRPKTEPRQALRLAHHFADAAYRIGRAKTLAGLRGGKLDADCEPTLARVVDGELQPLTGARPVLDEGQMISVRIEPRVPIHASIFCIHPHARIELLSRAQGGGVEIAKRETYILGQRSRADRLRGIELCRPSRSILPTDEPLPITIVVILTDRQVDLRSWDQSGVSRFAWTDPLAPASFARNVMGEVRPVFPAQFRIYKFELDLQTDRRPRSNQND